MGTSLAAVQAHCPLCGTAVLAIGGGGRLVSEDLHPILLDPELRRGYMLCDDCGVPADLPTNLTLN
jgi:hypothetical protein